jgi:hypothetical protein
MSTGCALDEDGNLKNATDIEFFDSETDTRPISGRTTHGEPQRKNNITGLCLLSFACGAQLLIIVYYLSGRQARRSAKGAKMAQYLAEEHLNSEGEPDKKTRVAVRRRLCKKKPKLNIDLGSDGDNSNDSDFESGSDSDIDLSSDDDIADGEPLTNAEVSDACCIPCL